MSTPTLWPRLFRANRGFGSFWLGQTLSRLGNYVYAAAISVLAYHTGGTTAVGIVLGAFSVVQLAVVLLGGLAADRVSRRALVAGTDTAAFGIVVVIAVLSATGGVAVWSLAALSAALGLMAALHLPAYRAIVPGLVAEDDLPRASALSSGANAVTTVAGPALGAALMAVGGPTVCMAVDAATFGVAACLMLTVPTSSGPTRGRTRLLADVLAGVRAAVSEPRLRLPILVGAVVLATVDVPVVVALPSIASDLGVGQWFVGASAAAVGIGTVLASAVLPRAPEALVNRIYLPAYGVAGLPLVLGLLWHNAVAWLVGALCYGVLIGARYVKYVLMQRIAARELAGRVFAVDTFLTLLMSPLSYAVCGALGVLVAPAVLISAGAAAAAVLTAVLCVGQLRRRTAATPDLVDEAAR